MCWLCWKPNKLAENKRNDYKTLFLQYRTLHKAWSECVFVGIETVHCTLSCVCLFLITIKHIRRWVLRWPTAVGRARLWYSFHSKIINRVLPLWLCVICSKITAIRMSYVFGGQLTSHSSITERKKDALHLFVCNVNVFIDNHNLQYFTFAHNCSIY